MKKSKNNDNTASNARTGPETTGGSSESPEQGIVSRRSVVGGISAAGAAGVSAAVASQGARAQQPQTAVASQNAAIPPQMAIDAPPWKRAYPRGQGYSGIRSHIYHGFVGNPAYLEVWAYTDQLSYFPGDTVDFHVTTSAENFSLQIIRDGAEPETVHTKSGVPGALVAPPEDWYEKGCNWPRAYSWRIPRNLKTGFYIATLKVENAAGETREYDHGFFVKKAKSAPKAKILLVAATSTWNAYNDWGGYSHYVSILDENEAAGQFGKHQPVITHHHRPFARGQLWLPANAPRKPHYEKHPLDGIPRYPCIEFAIAAGFSRWYCNAGWATYERPFAVWAEENGFDIDYATQHDLHFDGDMLSEYDCVVNVGHDEYWSWEMREALDRFIENGGRLARFAGNFGYQIRFEDEGKTQICYKERAHLEDPVARDADKSRLSSVWDDPAIGWLPETTFGLSTLWGIYAGVGVQVPRGTGGFTVYRPEHWAFEGSDLYYGDVFGGEAVIFGYEVDGMEYGFKNGAPVPSENYPGPKDVEILAMSPAVQAEEDHGHRGTVLYYGGQPQGVGFARRMRNKGVSYGVLMKALMTGDLSGLGGEAPTAEDAFSGLRGSGMMVHFKKGKGEVFHAATCEWVSGLQKRDAATERVTRNVLNRFIQS